MSYKNLLQEYYQKIGEPTPKYKTERCGGSPHEPLWISIVTLPNGKMYKGDMKSDKKSAEQYVAKMVYDILINKSQREKFYDKFVIFVDAENKPNFVGEFYNYYDAPNCHIECYTTTGHPTENKMKTFYDYTNFELHIATSTRPNSVDTLLLMDLGMYSMNNNDYTFIIVSSDKFAQAAAENLSSKIGDRVKAVRNFDQLREIIANLNK